MMRNILLILGIFIIFSSCERREDYLASLNPKPKISILAQSGAELSGDTVKLTLKSSTKSASTFKVKVAGNSSAKTVNVAILNGQGEVFKDGFPFANGTVLENGEYSFRYVPKNVGNSLLIIKIEDNFSDKTENTLSVNSFVNEKPVAKLDVKQIGVISEYEYTLDASKSFDQDQRFGGAIRKYVFSINEKFVETESSTIKWVFGNQGNYIIKLKVIDNDGAESSVVSQSIVVN